MRGPTDTQRVHGYCALCIARCGCVAVVEDGRFTRLEPDPAHPTGQALCAKGRAAPELVHHSERLTHPLRRTRPKGDPDPGWERINWNDALELTAVAMRRIADRDGPQALAFSMASPSTTAIADSSPWIRRLMNAFGTPNASTSVELCGWGRSYATRYTYGVGSVASGIGGAMADIPHSGCLILWGYNPSIARLTHATMIVEALKSGLRLIVVDPRQAGLANKADVWLRPRPGSDGALALGLANLLIERGWYDGDFVRNWSNGPLLVGEDLATAPRLPAALGLAERPLGPARWNFITGRELYEAILHHQPYRVCGLLGFGANLLLAHADVQLGRKALAALEFYAHADLFMNPTAEMADVVLPVASPFECEALKIGFDVSLEAQSLVQLRPAVVAPRGECRSDTQIVFDLACRLGLGDSFLH